MQSDFPIKMQHLALLLLTTLLLHGCTTRSPIQPPAISAPKQMPASIDQGPAYSLYVQARAALGASQPGQAEMLIERALRIEPGNPLYWHLLGQSKYDQGEFAQAVQFCLKAQSLIGDNRTLGQVNQELLALAHRRLGDTEKADSLNH